MIIGNPILVPGNGSGTGVLITKTITGNGTYLASNDNADGYSQVIINVPVGKITHLVNTTYEYSLQAKNSVEQGE